MGLTPSAAANEVPRLLFLVSETLGIAEISRLSRGESRGRLSISADDEDHGELGGHVVHVADAITPEVELIEFAGLGKPLDSYPHVQISGVHVLVTPTARLRFHDTDS